MSLDFSNFFIQGLMDIFQVGCGSSAAELAVLRFRTSKPSRVPFLWSDLSKPLLQFIEHLSGEPEHDQVEKGCNGRSSLLHIGTCRRVRVGLSPFTKIKNIKIVKIIFSYLFLTELDLDRFYQNSWNHKTVRLLIIFPVGQLRTSSPTKYVKKWKSETNNNPRKRIK